MTKTINQLAVAVKTRVNAGAGSRDAHTGLAALTGNHNETVAVKTRVNAGALTSNHNETVAVKTRVNAGDAWDAK